MDILDKERFKINKSSNVLITHTGRDVSSSNIGICITRSNIPADRHYLSCHLVHLLLFSTFLITRRYQNTAPTQVSAPPLGFTGDY